jgi:threonine/homoserine/homoserine lactone efflux protein
VRGQRVVPSFWVLGACFVALEIVVDGAVGLAADRLRCALARRARAARGLDVASGSVFVGLAAKLALTR